jgi:hypothetical protein
MPERGVLIGVNDRAGGEVNPAGTVWVYKKDKAQ